MAGPVREQPPRVLGETHSQELELNRLRARAGARSRPPASGATRVELAKLAKSGSRDRHRANKALVSNELKDKLVSSRRRPDAP